jgi:hypothetical protein
MAEGSKGQDLRFVWVQTKGPTAVVEPPDAPEVEILIPGDARQLAFALVVSGRNESYSCPLEVPLELHAKPVLPATVVADAGDDQVALVGHRVTLNGIRSHPRRRSAYRWIKVEGPPVREIQEEAWIYSFVPAEPGTYRFVLVTAADGLISQPDEVKVVVPSDSPAELAREAEASPAVEDAARRGIRSLRCSPALAREISRAFGEVAWRMSLYESYEDMLSEISRRLDAVLPADATARADWEREFLEPLTAEIVRALKEDGLDLSRPEAAEMPLTPSQKNRLTGLFQGIARGVQTETTAGRPVRGAEPAAER